MPCSPFIISEMLHEIHTMEKCDFLKPIIHSQIFDLCVIYEDNFIAPAKNTDARFSICPSIRPSVGLQ